jgi:hypothetical protein
VSFLAPWFLLLGGAALVPLLIHLLRRRIGVQLEFPAARYLARAEREHSRTLRMRNLLLMLLRVLAVLLLAGAAARPTSRVAGAGHAPTALAIVVDNSLSTSVVQQGTPLLDRIKEMARAAINEATADDRLWLVTADGVVRGGSAATLAEEVERVRHLAGAGRLRDAVTRAAGATEASGIEARQVVVLTDGQRTTWNAPVQLRGDVPMLIWAPSSAAPANHAVALAEARPVRWTPRGIVATRMFEGGGESTDSTTYRIALGERTLARGTAIASEEAIVRAAPSERGWTAGLVEIEPDELPADNIRHFALWIGPAPAVRVAPGAGRFVQEAVDVLRTSERVVDGAGILVSPADEATQLPALILAPADPVRAGAANRALERLGIPWRLGAPRHESAIARGEQLTGVSVTSRFQLVPRGVPDADTLATVGGGGEPWIVAGPGYVIVGSAMVPEATAFPVSASFLPWLGDMLSARLHAEPGTVRLATPGERVPRPSSVDALESVGGSRTTIDGADFEAPAAAGTYFFNHGTRRVGALVVNSDVSESRLERWPADELGRRIASSGRAPRVARDRAEFAALVFSGAARRSLLVPLLIALMLVLGAETIAATAGGRTQV